MAIAYADARDFLGQEEADRLAENLIDTNTAEAAMREVIALARSRGMPGLASRRWCPLCDGAAASAAKH